MATKRRKDIIEIMAPKEIPLPGYTTAKPLMAPIKLMLSELGAQDACIQLQELSIEYLRNSATATKAPIGDFLKLLYKGNKIPQGTHDFSELRELASKSYLVVTYALLEKMLRSVIVEYKKTNAVNSNSWKTKNSAGENLPPLLELSENLPASEKAKLMAYPEFTLLEHYRIIRVANSHVKNSTSAKAKNAFRAFSTTDLAHFKTCYALAAPNDPENLSFDDFMLFTRAIKYFSKIINEACA